MAFFGKPKPSPAEHTEYVEAVAEFGQKVLLLDLDTDQGVEEFHSLNDALEIRNDAYKARFGERAWKAAWADAVRHSLYSSTR